MAPSLRAFFLVAVVLCLSSTASFAMVVISETPAPQKDVEPAKWPLTNYPCQKPPAEEAACLIDEMLRHIKAGELETPRDKALYDQIVVSITEHGSDAQKEFILDSLIDIPQRRLLRDPDNKAQNRAATNKQQYQKMLLLLSLGKMDAAVDFLKHNADTTPMPDSLSQMPQIGGINFLLKTQTGDAAYEFARKTAKIFYRQHKAQTNIPSATSHPLAGLVVRQMHDKGFDAGMKVIKLSQEDNIYKRFFPNNDFGTLIARYARGSKNPKIRAEFDAYCKERGAQAATRLQEIPESRKGDAFIKAEVKFGGALRALETQGCLKDHPDILLNLADKISPAIVPAAAAEWHGMTTAEAIPTPREERSRARQEQRIKTLQSQAQEFRRIETAEDPLADIPDNIFYDSIFWAARKCPPDAGNACIQKVAKKYQSHLDQNVLPDEKLSFTIIMRVNEIQHFISRFDSPLGLIDFLPPQKIFSNAKKASSPWQNTINLIALKSLVDAETFDLYLAENAAAKKKNRLSKNVQTIVDIFQTTPVEQISSRMAPHFESMSDMAYIREVIPALEPARFDAVKDKLWQIYTHNCMNGRNSKSYNRLETRYAACLHSALSVVKISKSELP